MIRSLWILMMSLVAGTAWADAACLKTGENVSLTGIVAERPLAPTTGGKAVRVLLLRTATPVCIADAEANAEGARRTDRLQLLTLAEPALQGALAGVAGGRVRVNGILARHTASSRILVGDVVEVAEAFDLESARGELLLEPEIPVDLRFRKALLSSGLVAIFKNETDQSLAVTVEFSRESTNSRSSRDLVLNAGQSREIGEREGWAFVKDDRITLSRKGFKTVTIITPEL